jgi:hypothetical protein
VRKLSPVKAAEARGYERGKADLYARAADELREAEARLAQAERERCQDIIIFALDAMRITTNQSDYLISKINCDPSPAGPKKLEAIEPFSAYESGSDWGRPSNGALAFKINELVSAVNALSERGKA